MNLESRDSALKMKTSRWIRARREAAGWTQKHLAEKAGVTKPIVAQWEQGIAEPSAIALKRLLYIFESVVDFSDGRPESPSHMEDPPNNGSGCAAVAFSAESSSQRCLYANLLPPAKSAPNTRQLRPFLAYYGGKWRDTPNLYPRPEFATIVEPFAGSAGYSLRYPNLKIVLCELDPILAGVWSYLIHVKSKEIRAIPDIPPGGSVDDLKVCQEAKWLVGFWLNRGITSPRRTPSKWMREEIRPGSFWGERVRETIASQVVTIRHWKIYNCSYIDCPTPNIATWFVDPPYQKAGKYYRLGSDLIDYEALAGWCKSRPGQVIVCENAGAKWLPFRELAEVKTTRAERRSREVYWLSTFEDDLDLDP